MIFDINMDITFTRKAIFVADGYIAAAPSLVTYSNGFSRERIRIVFIIAPLTYLDIFFMWHR